MGIEACSLVASVRTISKKIKLIKLTFVKFMQTRKRQAPWFSPPDRQALLFLMAALLVFAASCHLGLLLKTLLFTHTALVGQQPPQRPPPLLCCNLRHASLLPCLALLVLATRRLAWLRFLDVPAQVMPYTLNGVARLVACCFL